MADPLRIALVDDDAAVLDALQLYLGRHGVDAVPFASAEALLAAGAGGFACIVADVRLPGASGVELMRRLVAVGRAPPVILITGHGDIDMAVAAIKQGATDFLEKPFDEARLLESIRLAAAQAARRGDEQRRREDLRARYDGLSERQRAVMDLAAAALSNKEIGQRLGISPRTVEIHRAWMMNRMGARNVADLVRIAMEIKGA